MQPPLMPLPLEFRISVTPRHPPVVVEDLAQILSIDLQLGQKDGFENHLKRALASAYCQGAVMAALYSITSDFPSKKE